MKCEECLPLVEEYTDGELTGQTNDLMAGHLAACASCADAHRKVLREQELYLRYECDAETTPAFWENVMVRAVAQENRRAPTQTLSRRLSSLRERLHGLFGNFSAPRFSPSLTALMLLIAVSATAVVMSYLNPKEKPSLPANVSQDASAPSTSATPDVLVTSSANTNQDEAAGGKGIKPNVNSKPQIAGRDNGEKNRYALTAKKDRRRDSFVVGHPLSAG